MRIQRIAASLTALNLVILLATFAQARVVGAQSPNPVLRGRVLELVDERGQIRARLKVESDGEVVRREEKGARESAPCNGGWPEILLLGHALATEGSGGVRADLSADLLGPVEV